LLIAKGESRIANAYCPEALRQISNRLAIRIRD
jgi:hypothetical protein